MSFARSFDEARGILDYVQEEKMDGMDGTKGSPIYEGVDNPPMEAGSVPHAPIDTLVPRRTKIHTRTDELQRKYASTGTKGGPSRHPEAKSYSSGKTGRNSLRPNAKTSRLDA